MNLLMSTNVVNQGFNQLNKIQTKLAFDYGLRQIKYMFDVDNILSVPLPNGAKLVGLSEMGRFTAIDYKNKIRYGYFPHNKTWSQAKDFGNLTKFDSIHDFKFIYDCFSLKDYELSALTHVVSNLKERIVNDHEKMKSF